MNSESKKTKAFSFTFEDMFKYRSIWMFFAIFWVMLFHSDFKLPGFLGFIGKIGYGGVDIFLFASGLGCCYSLKRNSNIYDFFKKRIINIIPMWIIFMALWIPYTIFFIGEPMNFSQIIGNLTGFGFFADLDNQFNWYVGALWVCYILAPLFVSVFYKLKSKKV